MSSKATVTPVRCAVTLLNSPRSILRSVCVARECAKPASPCQRAPRCRQTTVGISVRLSRVWPVFARVSEPAPVRPRVAKGVKAPGSVALTLNVRLRLIFAKAVELNCRPRVTRSRGVGRKSRVALNELRVLCLVLSRTR